MLNKKTVIIISACIFAAALIILGTWHIVIACNEYTLTLTLTGKENLKIEYGEKYEEQGAKANFFGSLISKDPKDVNVNISGKVDTEKLGTYTIKYTAKYRKSGDVYTKTIERKVTVTDTKKPEIELTYDPAAYTLPGHPYEEEGFYAYDNYDKDITDKVESYEQDGKVYYSVSDSSGNSTQEVREIFYDDPVPPELTLAGNTEVTISENETYIEAGFTALDNLDGDITEKVEISGAPISGRPGKYTVTYTVSDEYKNTVTAQRKVTVTSLQPVFSSEESIPRKEAASPNGKVIYLTFDDGPGEHTDRLLDILDKYNVKATFFVTESDYLYLIPRMAKAGHTVALHTKTHNYNVIYSSKESYFDDLYGIQSIVKDLLGYSPTIFRFPGGSSNLASRFNPGIMTELTELTKANGYRYFDWNVDSDDAGSTRTAEGVFNNVTKMVDNFEHSIVLQHDTKSYSVDAVEMIIEWGLENGYTFMPLTEYAPECEHNVQN